MLLPTALLCAFALLGLGWAGANLAEDYAEHIADSLPADDVNSCLLGTEGCEMFYPPEPTPESKKSRFIGGRCVGIFGPCWKPS